MDRLNELIAFLEQLEDKKIVFELNKFRDSIMVEAFIPKQIWEIEYMNEGTIEVEKFISDGQIFDETEIDVLFKEFSDDDKSDYYAQLATSKKNRDKNKYTREEFFSFLKQLEEEKLHYKLRRNKIDESILVENTNPGYKWQIKYLTDGTIEIEKYTSDGNILDEKEIPNLFK